MEVTWQGRVKEAAWKKVAHDLPLWPMHQVTAELLGFVRDQENGLVTTVTCHSHRDPTQSSKVTNRMHSFLPVQDQVLSDIQREKEVRQHEYANIPLLWLSAGWEGEITCLPFPGWDTSCLGKTKLINKHHFLCSVFQPSSGFH